MDAALFMEGNISMLAREQLSYLSSIVDLPEFIRPMATYLLQSCTACWFHMHHQSR